MRVRRWIGVAAVVLAGCGGGAGAAATGPAATGPAATGPAVAEPAAAATQTAPAPAAPPATPNPEPSPAAAGQDSVGTALAIAPEGLEAPEAVAAAAWIAAVAQGDHTTAWSLLGPRSQAELGSQERLTAMGAELREGWGAWATAPDRVIFRSGVLSSSGEGRLSVVTLVGTVTQEGVTERRTIAVPAYAVADSDDPADGRFEPFAEAGTDLTIEIPGEGATVWCEETAAVYATGPMEYATATASLDGAAPFEPDFRTELAEPGRIVFPLPDPPGAGEHVVTLALVTEAGSIYADASRYTAGGC